MNIQDVFHGEPDGHGGVTLVARRPVQTRDGKTLTVKPKSRAAQHPMIYRRPTADTLLTTPTPAENAEWSRRANSLSGFNGGTLWQGDLTPVGQAVMQVADALRSVRAVDKRRVKDAMAQALCAISNYGNYLETSEGDLGPSDVLSFEGNDELTLSDVHEANGIKPDLTTSEGARAEVDMNRRTGDAINAANARAWADPKFPTADAKPRDALAAQLQDINRNNAAFYDKLRFKG